MPDWNFSFCSSELNTKNIKRLIQIQNKDDPLYLPSSYLNIILLENQDKLLLQVNSSLCRRTNEATDSPDSPKSSSESSSNNSLTITFPITLIDSTWSSTFQLLTEFECSDGRSKLVTFSIPLQDENTQSPQFEYPEYTLVSEPCLSGTHGGYCPLNFETSIYLLDSDREPKNALSKLAITDLPSDLIQVSTGPMESNEAPNLLQQSDRSSSSALKHKIPVHLYLKEQLNFQLGHSFTFTLSAHNLQLSPANATLNTSTTIHVVFAEGSIPPDNCIELQTPKFPSQVFHAFISNLEDIKKGLALEGIQPSGIVATFESNSSTNSGKYSRKTDNDSFEEEIQLEIRYELKGDIHDLFEMNPLDGTITFTKNEIESFIWGSALTFQAIAYLDKYPFLYASVPLVVYFEDTSCELTPTTPFPSSCDECFSSCLPTNGKRDKWTFYSKAF